MLAATSRKAIISTASKATYATTTASHGFKLTTASNGIKVASSEEPGHAASLAVVIGGGARAESNHNAGVAHFLKNYGFKNNADRTAFRITREAELAGGVLSSNLSRESLVFSGEFLKDNVELFAEILSDVVTKQKFQDHEFIDVAHQTAAEASNAWATGSISALEAAHQTAFRHGLGHSIFAKPTAHISNAAVKAFAKELFVSGNVAFVGTGIGHETLEALAETYLTLPSGQVAFNKTTYYGGETRINAVSKQGEYVLAYEGAAANTADYAALQVLRYALGGDVNIKNRVSGVLAHTAAKFSEGTSISAFNFGYSDAGLFGVQVSAPTAETGAAIAAAAEQLKAAARGLSSEDFTRAVAQAKYAAATTGLESRLDRLETLGVQALQSGESTFAIENVTTSDIAKVAEKLLSSKATTVAVGDVANLPYADSVSL